MDGKSTINGTDYNASQSAASERIRRNIMSCNLKESVLTLCLNGGVCWKNGIRGVARCLCQPLFHGKNCELQRELQNNVETTDKIVVEGVESKFVTPTRSEATQSTSRVHRSSEATDNNDHHHQPCSPLELKESGCQNNSECIKMLVEGNKYKYKCRCLPPFFGSHCNLAPRHTQLGDINITLGGLIATSVIALSLLVIFLLLIYIATMKRTHRLHKWTNRHAHTKHHQNFKANHEPFTIFGDNPLTIPRDLPKIVFYKHSPQQSLGGSSDPFRTNDEFAWTNHNREQRTGGKEEMDRKVMRFHDDLRDVLFEDEGG